MSSVKKGFIVFGSNTFYTSKGEVNNITIERVKDAVLNDTIPFFFSELEDNDDSTRQLFHEVATLFSLKARKDCVIYVNKDREKDEVLVKTAMMKSIIDYAASVKTSVIGAFDKNPNVVAAYKCLGIEASFVLNDSGTEAPFLQQVSDVQEGMNRFLPDIDESEVEQDHTPVNKFEKDQDQTPVNEIDRSKPYPIDPACQRQVAQSEPEPVEPPRLGVDVPVSNAHLYPQYFKKIPEGWEYLDIYAVHHLFGINDASGSLHHADKKVLLAGVRTGGKSKRKDIKEARDALNRWLELNPE
jgi:hypothetical protein